MSLSFLIFHCRLFIASAAPAEARSCLELTLRPAARGRPLMPPAPVLVLLAASPVVVDPFVVADVLREEAVANALCGLMPLSRTLAVPLVVMGGSGRGREPPGSVWLPRFTGENSRVGMRAMGVLWPVMNSCRMASSGFIRRSGSQRRQRAMKSKKGSSSHLSTCWSVLDEGRRLLPFEDTVNRGLPMESKNSFFLV